MMSKVLALRWRMTSKFHEAPFRMTAFLGGISPDNAVIRIPDRREFAVKNRLPGACFEVIFNSI
jgi:hypothetical protein